MCGYPHYPYCVPINILMIHYSLDRVNIIYQEIH